VGILHALGQRIPEEKKRLCATCTGYKTIPEASIIVVTSEKGPVDSVRNEIILLYEEGFTVWKINSEGGIENYDKDPWLTPYQLFHAQSQKEFVSQAAHLKSTIGFVGMDKESAEILEKLKQSEEFKSRIMSLPEYGVFFLKKIT